MLGYVCVAQCISADIMRAGLCSWCIRSSNIMVGQETEVSVDTQWATHLSPLIPPPVPACAMMPPHSCKSFLYSSSSLELPSNTHAERCASISWMTVNTSKSPKKIHHQNILPFTLFFLTI